MKARRLSFVLSLPLALGLLGCGREDDGTGPLEQERRDVPTRTDDGYGTEDDESTRPWPQDEPGVPPAPDETGEPMDRDQGLPRDVDPDPTMPGGGAND